MAVINACSKDVEAARSTEDGGAASGPSRAHPEVRRWTAESIAALRRAYPDMDYCFSFAREYENWREQDVSFMNFLEPHIWMANVSDFYEEVGYNFEKLDSRGYEYLVRNDKSLYRQDSGHWKRCLRDGIKFATGWSGKPLITTECWSVVDYEDWPLLNWGWVKELCEFGMKTSVETQRWITLATSNLCGPQFVGMWRDIAWHKRLTDIIHDGTFEQAGDVSRGSPLDRAARLGIAGSSKGIE